MGLIIDQFVHTLQYGDAISGEALTIKRVLNELGFDSQIVSLNTHEKYKGLNISLEEFNTTRAEKCSLIINHFSISSPLNDTYKSLKNSKRALIYHNVTPPSWFSSYNQRVTEDLKKGRTDLSELINLTDLAIADSSFNGEELLELGFKDPKVLPLPLDPNRWTGPANPGILNVLSSHGGPNVLHVGRIAPNKCIQDVIKAFYFFHHKFSPKSRLWLIGSDTDTELYSFELRRLVSELRLKDAVTFAGSVSDDELKAFYEKADIYLCMSEHEGFCVPAIEALHFKVPLIFFNSSALPETMGQGAIGIDQKDPLRTACIMQELIHNNAAKEELISKSQSELSRFNIDIFKSNLSKLVSEALA